MKILVIDNSILVLREGKVYTNSMNGAFLMDLKSSGADVATCHFLVSNDTSISQFNLLENGIKVLPLVYRRVKVVRYFLAYLSFLKELRTFDFVYLYYPSSFKHVTLLCKLFGIQFGLYIRGQQKLDDKLSHWIYRNAYVIMTVSDFFTDKINTIVGREVASTIRPMISYQYDDIVLDRLYPTKTQYTILYFGRFDKEKGLRELILAVDKIRKDKYDFKLELVGDGSFASTMKELIQQMKLNEWIKIRPPVYDDNLKKEVFSNADIYIIPTYHEGFPRTLYESMIFGTPIITTMVGGIPALMKDHVNCLEIQPRSIESIQSALGYAFTHYDEMVKMAQRGTELMKCIIAKDRLSHGYDLYNKIIKCCNK